MGWWKIIFNVDMKIKWNHFTYAWISIFILFFNENIFGLGYWWRKIRENKIKSYLPVTKVKRSWRETKNTNYSSIWEKMEVLEGGKMHLVQMKKEIGGGKKKNCSPITKEREVGKENNLHWFPKKNIWKKNRKKKCIHEKRKDGWRERGGGFVYPF